ncbi:hypothetical protein TB2_041778 [Malus domestica]
MEGERGMDEEMVEFVREAFEGGEIDMDYEFDVPKFYDFTRPETSREAEEAEEWFLSAGGYQFSRKRFQKHCIEFCEWYIHHKTIRYKR